ncbi:hypothetical protein ACFV2H_44395 [Streptomyces sp. NPDC059629]|uniref:hypothetical protein n=1 Tax=Streptomyces sp. NPDC059629 TaxID=3346889 RepID=UPI00369C958D
MTANREVAERCNELEKLLQFTKDPNILAIRGPALFDAVQAALDELAGAAKAEFSAPWCSAALLFRGFMRL